ncbi:DUF4349 domain-containing protein [Bacillus salipaludis]|uniref:DUF4349 domain-containing protein n=1 Tax=Bacillus salipaludis TaxID=2547811 RepID=A0AA90R6L3_9BACI|nr:DUF4349 domain-containing protein [Bacillus salipaludis]MDQ6596793.1 DUF4349 domain-containing protein [Bacillus salipaludis]
MNRFIKWIPIVFVFLLLSACRSDSKSESAKMDFATSKTADSAQNGSQAKASLLSAENFKKEMNQSIEIQIPEKKVIYTADLELRVKKFEQTVRRIEEKVEKYGGYIAESNVIKEGKEQVSGSIRIRIPQKYFQSFLHDAEGQAVEVIQRNITGQDVTEEYVDLESRLNSKKVVEERLLSFMKKANKTEDLLKISADLASVQEVIETIEGKLKFLENQTAFSTVNIMLHEYKVIVPNIDKDNLNTLEKTKKQFMKSINTLIAVVSWLVVFVIGNLPILIIISVIGLLLYLYIKKRRNHSPRG